MKRNYLILSILFSNITYAGIIEHVIATPGVKHLNHQEFNNDQMPSDLLTHPTTKGGSIDAHANAATGQHETNITATGIVNFYASNDTKTSQILKIDRYMCIEKSCTHVVDSYDLNTNESIKGDSDISTTKYMQDIGTYEDEAGIEMFFVGQRISAENTNKVTVL